MKDEILEKIQNYKNKKFGDIAIDCNFKDNKYKLLFLTSDCSEDSNIMSLISNWRKKHEFWFPSQFEVTVERTKNWFKDRVIGAPDRLLFMIEIDNQYVGHVGLYRFNFDDLTCEIDNIVRGEDTLPGLIGDAIVRMMDWGRKEFGLTGYTLQTVSDNEKALRLYSRLGFKEYKKIPLVCIEKNNQKEWVPAPEGYKREILRYDIFMRLI